MESDDSQQSAEGRFSEMSYSANGRRASGFDRTIARWGGWLEALASLSRACI